MRSFALALSITAAFGVFAFGASAADPAGPYVGLGGGLHMPRNSDLSVGANARTADFDSGFLALGTLGYKFAEGLRLEGELGWREADVDNFSGTAWTGSQKTWSTMANLLYDFETESSVTPYLGAGLGLSWVGWKDNFRGPTTPVFEGTDKEFTWQGIGGIGVAATDALKFFLEYRYISTGNTSFAPDLTPATPVIGGHKDNSHNVLAGFRYAFGAPPPPAPEPAKAAPPPPAPPPPAAPPPPPPVPQKFIVFFDWDKSNLRADAAKIVSDAAAYAKTNGKARIATTGHADTSGTPAYNLALSERRANIVKAELIRLGIPANEIAVSFKGESQPLVTTGDGAREPQNRRVEIVIE